MTFIEWQERFRTGIPWVDYEHQELIALLNELHAVLGEEVGLPQQSHFLGELYARISAHFALEEKVMRDMGYEGFPTHKDAHEDLLDQLREIMDSCEEGHYEGSISDLGAVRQ
jgi:hemerythrin-like metal-binding protein